MLKIDEGGAKGSIIILADADDDCPVDMQAKFLDFVDGNPSKYPVSFVLANREYEAWMIACGESMREHEAVRDDACSHAQPESVRGAKGYFEREILREGIKYSESVDQAKFSAKIDINLVAERCRSFRKLVSEIGKAIQIRAS